MGAPPCAPAVHRQVLPTEVGASEESSDHEQLHEREEQQTHRLTLPHERDCCPGAERRVATNVASKGHRSLTLRNVLLQSCGVARDNIILSYDEAMAICLLLAEAAVASVNDEPVRDTWVEEARLMVELILGRTDE